MESSRDLNNKNNSFQKYLLFFVNTLLLTLKIGVIIYTIDLVIYYHAFLIRSLCAFFGTFCTPFIMKISGIAILIFVLFFFFKNLKYFHQSKLVLKTSICLAIIIAMSIKLFTTGDLIFDYLKNLVGEIDVTIILIFLFAILFSVENKLIRKFNSKDMMISKKINWNEGFENILDAEDY